MCVVEPSHPEWVARSTGIWSDCLLDWTVHPNADFIPAECAEAAREPQRAGLGQPSSFPTAVRDSSKKGGQVLIREL